MDPNVSVRPATMEELEKLTEFCIRINGCNETGSRYMTCSRGSVRRDLHDGILCRSVAACWVGESPAGILNCFVDQQGGTAHTALLVDDRRIPYEAAADALLETMGALLSKKPAYEFLLPQENRQCAAYLEARGAQQGGYVYHLRAHPVAEGEENPQVEQLSAEDSSALEGLLEELKVPILAHAEHLLRSENRQVYVFRHQGQAEALGILRWDRPGTAVVEALQARPGWEPRLEALLTAILHEAFPMAQEVLAEATDHFGQEKVYLRAGFRITQTDVVYRLDSKKRLGAPRKNS